MPMARGRNSEELAKENHDTCLKKKCSDSSSENPSRKHMRAPMREKPALEMRPHQYTQ
jgi:hypothetical protein